MLLRWKCILLLLLPSVTLYNSEKERLVKKKCHTESKNGYVSVCVVKKKEVYLRLHYYHHHYLWLFITHRRKDWYKKRCHKKRWECVWSL